MKREIDSQIATHQKALRNYIRLICTETFLADDICQETLIICFQKYETLRDKSRFLPWAKSIARNLYYRKLESRQRSDSFDENSQMDEALIDQVEFIYRQQKRELLFSLFAKLPLSQRELAIEYYISGIPRDAICRSRNISKSVFDSRLLRMRNKIRKYLRKSHSNRQEIVFINRFHELLKGDYAMDEFRIEISRTLVPELIEQDENLMSFIKNQRQRFRKDLQWGNSKNPYFRQ